MIVRRDAPGLMEVGACLFPTTSQVVRNDGWHAHPVRAHNGVRRDTISDGPVIRLSPLKAVLEAGSLGPFVSGLVRKSKDVGHSH